ncbi:U2 snRNP component prp10, partial [Dimargaris xerosporica]
MSDLDAEIQAERERRAQLKSVASNSTDALDQDEPTPATRKMAQYTAPQEFLDEIALTGAEDAPDPFDAFRGRERVIAKREDEYHARRRQRALSPDRADPFAQQDAAEAPAAYIYAEAMREAEVEREHQRVLRKVAELQKEGVQPRPVTAPAPAEPVTSGSRKSRWDMDTAPAPSAPLRPKSRWDMATPVASAASDGASTRKRSRWDETPVAGSGSTAMATPRTTGSRWDATPKRTRSRWDETPVASSGAQFGETPVGNLGLMTPTPGQLAVPMTPTSTGNTRLDRELDQRNRPLTDEELDALLPAKGYEILQPPASYVPIHTPARKLTATPTPMGNAGGFMMQEEDRSQQYDVPPEVPGMPNLPFFKQEDMQYFGKLMDDKDETQLSADEAKERRILRLLLKIKNGTPPMRKAALRQITDKARDFGPGPLFNQILPLLMSPALEDQERHLLVKVIDRILYKLDDLVRPFVHKILVVIEPMLIDSDYYARIESREIISNLSKAAGLATMIATMRPDIDHVDEYVRNTTARAFSVVASALGIPTLLPFLKAVCKSKKSWQARHTGIKIIQQIAILMGCAILPHLRSMVEIIAHGLEDEQQKVRTITALAIAALAEAAAPYGIESFDSVLKPLWTGIRKHRGKGLAAFLKAIGYIIPLMDSEYANYYTREVMLIVIREFQSPDEEMKKIVLKVVKQCAATDGVEPAYLKAEILPEFFRNFWVRRMALDRRSYRQVVETTVELSNKVGVSEVVGRIVEDLKDEAEPYRKMVMETTDRVIQ